MILYLYIIPFRHIHRWLSLAASSRASALARQVGAALIGPQGKLRAGLLKSFGAKVLWQWRKMMENGGWIWRKAQLQVSIRIVEESPNSDGHLLWDEDLFANVEWYHMWRQDSPGWMDTAFWLQWNLFLDPGCCGSDMLNPSHRLIFQVEVLGISSTLLELQHNSIACCQTVSGGGLLAKSHQIPQEPSKSPKVSLLTEPIAVSQPVCTLPVDALGRPEVNAAIPWPKAGPAQPRRKRKWLV